MDERADRDREDAIGQVAIAGVIAICNVLVVRGIVTRHDLGQITDFMVGAVDRSGTSPQLQADLRAMLDAHLVPLWARFDRLEKDGPTPEA